MIRTITIALALLAGCGNAFSFSGSNSGEFNREFNLAIKDLTMGRTVKALPRLLELSKADPTNANLHYLIGLCYTENADNPEEAISHLELAEKEMVRDYIVHSYQEKRVPIYVYYYLAKAYAQNGDCSKAVAAKEHFFNNYQVYADEDYYITQAQKLIADCINRPEILKPELCPEESMPFLEAVKVETTAPGNSRELKTRVVDYNMKSALYGIQIGAFKGNAPSEKFRGMKNINAFMGTDGTLRYVIGRFTSSSQAEELKDVLATRGFKDAFVVDISREQKFSREVLNLNYKPESKYAGKVDLRVQIGAFREHPSFDDLSQYFNIDGIREVQSGDMTLLTVGSFTSYKKAQDLRDELVARGTKDAFIVAFENDRKLPLQEAINYLKTDY